MARNVLIALLERRAGRKSIGASVFFERKIVDFLSKNTLAPKKSFLGNF